MLPYIDIRFLHLHLGPLRLDFMPTFGLMLWVAAVVAAIVMDRSFRRARVNADAMSVVAITVVFGIVGAKLWHVIDTPSEFREFGWQVLWARDGYAWYGGLLFGICALLFQGWWAKIGMLRMLDLVAPAAAIGQGIGRIGCFLSGDGCYGIEIKPVHFFSFVFRPWGMSFPKGLEPVFVPVYPTPLYEFAAALLICAWLWWMAGKQKNAGAIVGQYFLFSGIARFLVEFIRRNPKILWGLSNAQLASIGSIIAGIILIGWAATRPANGPDEAAQALEKAA
jgi:phosphatidylglycerol:prolipoprotein diacylglycerol transferase